MLRCFIMLRCAILFIFISGKTPTHWCSPGNCQRSQVRCSLQASREAVGTCPTWIMKPVCIHISQKNPFPGFDFLSAAVHIYHCSIFTCPPPPPLYPHIVLQCWGWLLGDLVNRLYKVTSLFTQMSNISQSRGSHKMHKKHGQEGQLFSDQMWSKWLLLWNDCWCQTGWFEYLRNCWSSGIVTHNSLQSLQTIVWKTKNIQWLQFCGQKRFANERGQWKRKVTVMQITTHYSSGMQKSISEHSTSQSS